MNDSSWHFPDFIPQNSWLWILIYFNAIFLLSRFFHRFYFVHKTYGLLQGVLSIPRLVWGNIVNIFALFRAFSQYKRDKNMIWDKTEHEFPDEIELIRVEK